MEPLDEVRNGAAGVVRYLPRCRRLCGGERTAPDGGPPRTPLVKETDGWERTDRNRATPWDRPPQRGGMDKGSTGLWLLEKKTSAVDRKNNRQASFGDEDGSCLDGD